MNKQEARKIYEEYARNVFRYARFKLNNLAFELNITSQGGNYSVHFTGSTLGSGGVMCRFHDSTQTDIPGPAQEKLKKRKEITSILNRNNDPISKLTQYGFEETMFTYRFRVCKHEGKLEYGDKKDVYHGSKLFGINGLTTEEIVYYTPANPNSEILEMMDAIVSTIEAV